MTPRKPRKTKLAGLAAGCATAFGVFIATCNPLADAFCRGVYTIRPLPRGAEPGERLPPCGPDGFKFPQHDGCLTLAARRPDGGGDCGDLYDDPESKGRCFAVMPNKKPKFNPVVLTKEK